MRLSIIGQAAFGQAVLERLRADGHEISGVSAPSGGTRPDALWAAGEAAGLALAPTGQLKEAEHLARWRDIAGDLCVMAFVTDILPDRVLSLPPLGTIQYHPSIL